MAKIVGALVADKDNEIIIKELNCLFHRHISFILRERQSTAVLLF